MHLGSRAFKELPATPNEERVTSEDRCGRVRRVLIREVIADAVLGMTGCVERIDRYRLAQCKGRGVKRSRCYVGAVFTADDRGVWKVFEHLLVPASMIPVVVGVYDRGQLDLSGID